MAFLLPFKLPLDMLRRPAQHLQNCWAFCSHFRGLKPPATLQDRLQWPCSSVSPKWLIYLYWSSLVSPKWFNYLCTWNEHCQQKHYTDNLESYTGRISWAIFQKKKMCREVTCPDQMSFVVSCSLPFLGGALSTWCISLTSSQSWLFYMGDSLLLKEKWGGI